MRLCYLCQKREADKAGTHVIPYFLLKDMLHVGDGKVSRDKEFSFELGILNTQSYVGKAVLPDEIERLIGGKFNPDKLKEKQNPYIVDYFWCVQCESDFAALESYYSSRSMFVENNGMLINKCPAYISTLLWCSVLWRISETDFFGKEFIGSSEHQLMRQLLSDTLNRIKEPTPESFEYIRGKVSDSTFRYQISVEQKSNEIEFVSRDENCANPTIVVVNKRVVIFYFNDIDSRAIPSPSIPGVSVFISEAPINSIDSAPEKAFPIDFQTAGLIKKHEFNSLAAKWVEHIRWLANEAFQKFRGVSVPESVIAQIMNELTNSDEVGLTPSEKYESQRVMKVISKNLYSALFK